LIDTDDTAETGWESQTVTIVGTGYMGLGIGQVLACAGADVVMVDVDRPRAEEGVVATVRQASDFEARGLLPAGSAQSARHHIRAAVDRATGLAMATMVIEAVFEERATKIEVIAEIERFAPVDAIIASNTSSIPIAELSQQMRDPSRMLGMHWFNPPQFVPGVEVIPGPTTRPGVLASVVSLLRSAGKSPTVVRDSPGFVGNRLQFALFREAALMLEEGIADAAQIDEVVKSTFGFRLPFFGPFAIADMAGLDVYAGAYATLQRIYGDRFSPPGLLTELVSDGRLGTKSGGGFLALDEETTRAMLEQRDRSYVSLLEAIRGAQVDSASDG
jgi:3-hydroxybutyryl-CoA dehydrogenase